MSMWTESPHHVICLFVPFDCGNTPNPVSAAKGIETLHVRRLLLVKSAKGPGFFNGLDLTNILHVIGHWAVYCTAVEAKVEVAKQREGSMYLNSVA